MQFFKTYQVGLVCPSSMVYYVLSSSNKWRNTKGVFGWADGDGMQCSGDAAAPLQQPGCNLFPVPGCLVGDCIWRRNASGKEERGAVEEEEEKRERRRRNGSDEGGSAATGQERRLNSGGIFVGTAARS